MLTVCYINRNQVEGITIPTQMLAARAPLAIKTQTYWAGIAAGILTSYYSDSRYLVTPVFLLFNSFNPY